MRSVGDEGRDLIAPETFGRRIRLFGKELNCGIVSAVWRGEWDIVNIAGYTNLTAFCCILICIVRRIPFVIQADSQLIKKRKGYRVLVKRLFFWPLIRRCKAAIGISRPAKRYWETIGIPEDSVFVVPCVSHLDAFRETYLGVRAKRDAVREELGISPDEVAGVFVGHLLELKGLDLVLNGLATIAEANRPRLILIGDGPERARLEAIAESHGLPVQFLGWQENTRLPAYYAASDFFFLSSRREAWGIVVAEAMTCGLPIALSDQVGAAEELLADGENGYLVTEATPDAWGRTLERFVTERTRLAGMGQRSLDIIRDWNLDMAATGFLSAMRRAAEKTPRLQSRAGILTQSISTPTADRA